MTTINPPSASQGVRAGVRRSRTAPVSAPTSATTPALEDEPSALQSITSLLGTLLMIVAVAAVLFFAIGPRFFGYQTATMLTASMAPEIVPGDVVVTTAQPVSGIAVGDVISYHIPVEDHRVETHRVTEVIRGTDGTTSVRTRGDANEAVDPWIATLEGDYVYEVKAVIPVVGDVIRALRTPIVNQVLLYGVPVVLVGGLLTMIWARPKNGPESSTGSIDDDASAVVAGTGISPDPRAPHDRTNVSQLPVLDRGVLDTLGEELSSQDGALYFASTFVDMLPQRIDAIEAAFAAEDMDAAVVALLSLNVSSSMVGARRLEESSSTALELARNSSIHSTLIAQLRTLGLEFQSALGGIMR